MTVSFATYNIWFDKFEQVNRLNNIIKEIIEHTPRLTVIALQEVTLFSYTFIQKSELHKYYHIITSVNFNECIYDNIFLIDKTYEYEDIFNKKFVYTKMNRYLRGIKVYKNDDTFLIFTSHLESEFKKNIPNVYKLEQFKSAFSFIDSESNIDKYSLVIFMLDTNILSFENDLFKIPPKWKDYFIEFGSPRFLEYTYDYTKNNNIKGLYKSRLDRIYYKNINNNFQPVSFSFLGKEPVNELYSSDHFGVVASFEPSVLKI
jgi:hypothetical protein